MQYPFYIWINRLLHTYKNAKTTIILQIKKCTFCHFSDKIQKKNVKFKNGIILWYLKYSLSILAFKIPFKSNFFFLFSLFFSNFSKNWSTSRLLKFTYFYLYLKIFHRLWNYRKFSLIHTKKFGKRYFEFNKAVKSVNIYGYIPDISYWSV